MSALTKITNRAKLIRKKKPALQWSAAVKQASAEYRAGKLGKVGTVAKVAKVGARKKSASRQTGSSNIAADKKVKAKAPGKRVVKHRGGKSTVYTERRKNRSDKPGKLTGGLPNGSRFKSLADVKAANKKAGYFFFSPGTMKFFNSKIVSPLLYGRYFVTSETFVSSDAKLKKTTYSARYAADNGNIKTLNIGGKDKWSSKADALAAIRSQVV